VEHTWQTCCGQIGDQPTLVSFQAAMAASGSPPSALANGSVETRRLALICSRESRGLQNGPSTNVCYAPGWGLLQGSPTFCFFQVLAILESHAVHLQSNQTTDAFRQSRNAFIVSHASYRPTKACVCVSRVHMGISCCSTEIDRFVPMRLVVIVDGVVLCCTLLVYPRRGRLAWTNLLRSWSPE